MPSDWKVFSSENVQLLFSAMDQQASRGITINRIAKSDLTAGTTLEDVHKLFNDSTASGLEPENKDAPTYTLHIDGKTAPVIEGKGSAQGENIYYLNAALEAEHHFYRIFLFHPGGSASADHEDFVRIAESVKILNDELTMVDTGRSSYTKQTLTSEDGLSQIQIPSNWLVTPNLSSDADIEAAFVSNEDYMVVLREAKEELGNDITLQEYYNYIMKNNADPDGTASISERTPVKIHGMNGWQVEVLTEVDQMRIGYVYTFLESTNYFSQIIFWTTEGRFDKAKADYKNYTETYSETL